jgi:hypothetical protein
LARLDHVLRASGSDIRNRGRLRHSDSKHAAGCASGTWPNAHEHAHGTGAHEVQAGRVGRAAAEDARDLDVNYMLVANKAP